MHVSAFVSTASTESDPAVPWRMPGARLHARLHTCLHTQVWEGLDAVKTGRKMLGETKPLESLPGTIRGDLCLDVGRSP